MSGRGRLITVVRRAEDFPPGTPQPTPCRIWQGALDRDGYGYVMVDVDNTATGRQRRPAHRWVWESVHGPLQRGLVVRHKCDNRPCYRLSHLEIGTVADNNRDARERKRHWSPPALSPSQSERVLELVAMGFTHEEIAACFGVSRHSVGRVTRLGPEGLAAFLEENELGHLERTVDPVADAVAAVRATRRRIDLLSPPPR
jgi:hypothetical protein